MPSESPSNTPHVSTAAPIDQPRTGLRHIIMHTQLCGRHQRGSMLVVAISSVLVATLMLGFVVNFSHWQEQKNLIADVAEVVADAGIRNQLTYRAASNPPTNEMIDAMVVEQDLLARLHQLDIGYEFGLTQGTTYISRGGDPDPATEPFNTMRVEVCTPLNDITGNFNLPSGKTCIYAESRFDLDAIDDCRCDHVVCPDSSYHNPLNKSLCMLGCTVGSLLGAAVNTVFDVLFSGLSTSLGNLLIALDCVLETLVISVNKLVEWVLGDDSVQLTYTRYT